MAEDHFVMQRESTWGGRIRNLNCLRASGGGADRRRGPEGSGGVPSSVLGEDLCSSNTIVLTARLPNSHLRS